MRATAQALAREARLGEFRLLLLALGFISVALSAVWLFGDRVERAMQAQTSALLGADAVVASTRPLSEDYDRLARSLGLQTARTVSFLSMAIGDGGSRLARVKAVSEQFPLRGEVVTRAIGDAGEGDDARLRPGEAWTTASMVAAQSLAAGDALSLGRGAFRVEREILLEPQGGIGAFRIAPRVMIRLDELDQTGLLTPASRARFRLLVAGPAEALDAFAGQLRPQLAAHEEWRVADIRSDELNATVGRVMSYLNLAVLLAVMLAVVAMAVSAQGLWRRQAHAGALARCLGASHGAGLRRLAGVYLLASVPTALAGCLVGGGAQALAASLVARATGIALPSPGLAPLALTLGMTVATVLAVMLPFLFAQRRVPVMTLLRAGQRDRVHAGHVGVLVVAALVVGYTLLLAADVLLAVSVLAALAGAAVAFWLLIRVVLGSLARAVRSRASAWFIGLRSLASQANRSAWLASAFGAAAFALVLLAVVRGDLFQAWEETVPANAPNLFLVNIQADQVDGVRELLAGNDAPAERFYPIFRGRLVRIDDRAVAEADFDSETARHRVNHDFNLTEDGELPAGNEISAGAWFDGGRGFSVEAETADSLGLGIGSQLVFDVGGVQVAAPVTSIRRVQWDSMKPNFFVIGSPGLFGDAPRSFITAAHAGGEAARLSKAVSDAFPSITLIDLDMIIQRVRVLVDQAGSAVTVVFSFTLAASLLVLVAMLQGQRAVRRRDIALYKTLGATRNHIRAAMLVEFGALGAVAGAVGGALALFGAWLLAGEVFRFEYTPSVVPLLWSTGIGAVLVGVGGYLSIRPLVAVQPVRLLAE